MHFNNQESVTKQQFVASIGKEAQWALEQEVQLTPKPGLVDLWDNGSHDDLSLSLMLISARLLGPYFMELAECGYRVLSTLYLRERIGLLGREAEADMMVITDNVNTHRGAIWALGLLSVALAQEPDNISVKKVCIRASVLANLDDQYIPASFSNGKMVQNKYQVSGAKGEAQEGFPSIVNISFPTLVNERRKGSSEQVARLNTLLAFMASVNDTCVLRRAGQEGLSHMQDRSKEIIELGGAGTFIGFTLMRALNKEMIALNTSPGGVADLFAATLFLDKVITRTTNERGLDGTD